MLIRAIDFETSGLPENPSAAIVEIGWTDIDLVLGDPIPGAVQAHIGATQSFLCNPGHPIPPEIRAVHHIGDADVADAVAPAEGLKRLMEGNPAYFVAHKADFEAHFFKPTVHWICTYKVALRLYPDAPGHSNQVLRYLLDLDLDHDLAMPPHRAGPDTYVTAHIFARMIEDGKTSLDDMVRWSSGPALFHKVGFGKHRGSLWADLPSDYLNWIVDKSDLDADTKANARYRLKQRERAA